MEKVFYVVKVEQGYVDPKEDTRERWSAEVQGPFGALAEVYQLWQEMVGYRSPYLALVYEVDQDGTHQKCRHVAMACFREQVDALRDMALCALSLTTGLSLEREGGLS